MPAVTIHVTSRMSCRKQNCGVRPWEEASSSIFISTIRVIESEELFME